MMRSAIRCSLFPARRGILLSLVLLLAPGLLRAQLSQLSFERLSTNQGLHGTQVLCILQDSRGYMWFGTDKGLNRYDGYSFTVYQHEPGKPSSIVDARVQSLWEDEQGTLWVGTWNGLEKFDRSTETFSHFLPEPGATDQWSNVIYDVREDRSGTLWVTGKGLKSFDRSTGKFTSFPHTKRAAHEKIENNVDAIFEDSAGELWVGTAGALEHLDRATRSYTPYWIDPNIKRGSAPNFFGFHWIQRIYEDRSGILWLCTNGGPVAFNRKTGEFKPYRIHPAEPESSAAHSVSSIVEDDSGVLWIGSWGGGWMTYNVRADSFEAHPIYSLTPSGSVCALYKDRAGTIWIGTNGAGVSKVVKTERRFSAFVANPNDFTPASRRLPAVTSSIQSNDIRFIYQFSREFISIGTGTGVDRFDRQKELFDHGAGYDWPYSITGGLYSRVASVVWTGMEDDGINRVVTSPYRRTYYSTREAGLGGSACSFFEDRRGILWMLTSGAGVCQFDPRTEEFRRLGIGNSQPFVAARMIIEDSLDPTPDGWGLWIGTQDGLWRYDARSDAFSRFGHNALDPHSLSSNSVSTVFQDRHGTLWVGTDRGLNRMDRASRTFERYTVDDGLPESSVRGILEDDRGRLWVSTTNAISRFDPESRLFISFPMKGVLPGIRFGAGCCLYSDGHELYFGGNGGFVVFDPDSVEENTYVPPVVISGFKVFDAAIALDSAMEEKRNIELSHNENTFTVEFKALNFIHPEDNQHAYMLVGYDTSWNYAGSRQYARYSDVQPGRYVFSAKGSNNNGVWNQEGATLAIVILPPWWKTTWFSILLWVVAAGSVGGTVRYYERRKLKQRIAELERERAVERERARISQDMHDEVGSSLSEIAILSELAKRNPEEAGEHVDEISARTAELIDNVGEIVWAMNPKNDTLDNLLGHVRRYAVKYLNIAGIGCDFVLPESIPPNPVAAEVRRHLYLAVKETLHNIVKHAAASEVRIAVEMPGKSLRILIHDNGRGFIAERPSETGNGLSSMRNRMTSVGGTVDIESRPGSGTTVTLMVRV